ncbi:hypothetical protein BFN67_21575 [Pseudaminobacter manganicus]|uniref:Uncharacterized protein n=1 Tax=Manganibacter manganicus TaxID=1873176 RepID=A0A1V8RMZ9_9HYPH|nr:hypothetical protein BFN67_21575 [Pseudaminobacter manganicus]
MHCDGDAETNSSVYLFGAVKFASISIAATPKLAITLIDRKSHRPRLQAGAGGMPVSAEIPLHHPL